MIKAHILQILAGAPASGMAVPYLRVELGVRINRQAGEGEFNAALQALKASKFITDAETGLSDDLCVKITAKGREAASKL